MTNKAKEWTSMGTGMVVKQEIKAEVMVGYIPNTRIMNTVCGVICFSVRRTTTLRLSVEIVINGLT
jgi:hypothetical protein